MQEELQVEELAETIREHLNTRQELAELKASEKISGVIAGMLSGLLVMTLLFITFLFFSIAAAKYICYLKNDPWSGFAIVGGINFAIALVVLVFRKRWLSFPIRNRIIRQMFKQE
ncbi:MAG TPA: phage holin family protein [Bacteroidia bacterium]|jgi:formate/nitrite transporter FocA (FNT family)